jgi:hypothetical protein
LILGPSKTAISPIRKSLGAAELSARFAVPGRKCYTYMNNSGRQTPNGYTDLDIYFDRVSDNNIVNLRGYMRDKIL